MNQRDQSVSRFLKPLRSKPSSSTVVRWGLSLTVAVFIWLFSIRGVEFTVSLPVEVTYATGEDAVVLGNPPESIMVEFEADGLSMLGFQLIGKPDGLSMVVDLRGFSPDSPGITKQIILKDDLFESLPLMVRAEAFEPSLIEFSLDRVGSRVLPVAVVSGPVPARYMSTSLRKSHVRVTGPASVLLSIDSVHTEPVSSAVRMEQQTALALPGGVYSDETAAVTHLRNPVPVVPGVRRAY
ncbi:MAG: hypothetical protein R6V62_10145 [Candidatus Fermentibacteraceae bacterium]